MRLHQSAVLVTCPVINTVVSVLLVYP